MSNKTPTNLPAKDFAGRDITTEFFNNFFKPDLAVSANIDSAVLGYFEQITGNRESARLLASAVLYTALTQNIDPMSVITELNEITKKNVVSSGTSYYERVNNNTDIHALPGPLSRPAGIFEVNAYLTAFLNLNRVNTSLLGVSNQPQINKYVNRAILP